MANDEAAVLASAGPRLRALRKRRDTTLTQLAETVRAYAWAETPARPVPDGESSYLS